MSTNELRQVKNVKNLYPASLKDNNICIAQIQNYVDDRRYFSSINQFLEQVSEVEVAKDLNLIKNHYKYFSGSKEAIVKHVYDMPMSVPVYEIFYDDTFIKPYFDLDKVSEKQLILICEYIVTVYRAAFKLNTAQLSTDDILLAIRLQDPKYKPKSKEHITFKSDINYYSVHIIINNGFYHTSISENALLASFINRTINKVNNVVDHDLIDECVYKYIQLMRVPLKCKKLDQQKNDMLFPMTFQTFKNNRFNENAKIKNCYNFFITVTKEMARTGYVPLVMNDVIVFNNCLYPLDYTTYRMDKQQFEFIGASLKGIKFSSHFEMEINVLTQLLKSFEQSYRVKRLLNEVIRANGISAKLTNDDMTTTFSNLLIGSEEYSVIRISFWERVHVTEKQMIKESEIRQKFNEYMSRINRRVYYTNALNQLEFVMHDIKKYSKYEFWGTSRIIGDIDGIHINCFVRNSSLNGNGVNRLPHNEIKFEFNSMIPFTIRGHNIQNTEKWVDYHESRPNMMSYSVSINLDLHEEDFIRFVFEFIKKDDVGSIKFDSENLDEDEKVNNEFVVVNNSSMIMPQPIVMPTGQNPFSGCVHSASS